MICQRCNENKATVHVTEIVHVAPPPQAAPHASEDGKSKASAGEGEPQVPHTAIQEQHLCERCAEAANLPSMPAKKTVAEIWKLLQASAQRSQREVGVACPECGMTLLEFRQRGRLGCPRDYEVFAPQLRDLLERIHGSTRHVGRGPGLDAQAQQRMQRLQELHHRLQDAIRTEAYEDAARLRDEIKSLGQS